MNAHELIDAHEYAITILEKIVVFEDRVNVQRGMLIEFSTFSPEFKGRVRNRIVGFSRAIDRLWGLYNQRTKS